ncbi:MAG TPA: transmembrane sensor domain-containing protein [Cyanobacteria bacterium UBA8553]|nr:transmembrane sensor domain-containing protein [Cyanobacteria bacterium UBA8553]
MQKLVVLKLDGDFKQGFRAMLEIGPEGDRPETEITGKLPPAPELAAQYQDWQLSYRRLGKAKRIIKIKQAEIDGSLKTRREECRTLANDLCDRLNTWLRAESFFSIREKWLEKVSTSDEMRVMIRTDNRQLWQLPWHQWDLLERYNQAEIGFSALGWEQPPVKEPSPKNQLRILAIFGSSEGIQVEEDRQQLENLLGAATTFLVEPQRQELNEQLWKQSWDILFFAGHSQTEDERGRIYLNRTDSFTLDELRYALKKAVEGGLQLAIFNSCDGLGLARELEQLHIPQLIVMREPVPDKVAQLFLKYFLDSFATGNSLYQAVREARQRLQGMEENFLCASWLPVICQNPAAEPFTWPKLSKPLEDIPPGRGKRSTFPFWRVFVTSLVVTSVLMGVRSLGVLQKWELNSYDQLLRQRPSELADSRILLVGAEEKDIRKYKYPLRDVTLAQLVAKLEKYQPVAIGLDIVRDQPVPPGHELLVTQLQHNQRLVTVCSFGTNPEDAIAPPPNSRAQQVGFIDLENDQQDSIIRRHLQSRTPNSISPLSPCKTSYSLSLQLAYRYLQTKGIPVKTTPEKNWQFGRVVVKRLKPRSGGYQNLDARGNQVLINYRATPQIAQRVTIEDVLTGKLEPEWVKNRVVFIGVTAASVQDHHYTPYGRMRGLEVHAHMVSQILSAVENGRPLIWWLPQWGDALWVLSWSLMGGILVYQLRSQNLRKAQLLLRLVLAVSICVTFLYGLCWVFLLQGGWLPLVPAAFGLVITGVAIAYPRFPAVKR